MRRIGKLHRRRTKPTAAMCRHRPHDAADDASQQVFRKLAEKLS
jgi:hypothetical protein